MQHFIPVFHYRTAKLGLLRQLDGLMKRFDGILKSERTAVWIAVIVVLGFARQTLASRCLVTGWNQWSGCMGNCDFAQRIRNRDVLRPSFPERDLKTGALFLRDCPPLYEVESCVPRECEDETPFAAQTVAHHVPDDYRVHSDPLNITQGESSKERKGLSTLENNKRTKLSGIGLYTLNATVIRDKCEARNEHCCRVSRTLCPDGSKPKKLIRWHRQKGETFCRAFNYPFCDKKLEQIDGPMVTENACTESCFNSAEKTILSTLRIL